MHRAAGPPRQQVERALAVRDGGFDALGEKLLTLAGQPLPPATRARRWRIPVAYGGEHGIDLEEVA